ncbi:hypothetical protein JZ751_008260 [Albula glossodonta]|uniref:C2H2-type domain-containing protein n=1 Tax=Albula glossodonta TaxID=121402 RepID=A0A8T2N904_9TELE|nr:hypothetical protein JZ751_008260 [Albula glossodonta]
MVTSELCPIEQTDHCSAGLVTVKEEIEEVCIGEIEGYSEDGSDSPVSLHDRNTEDISTTGSIAHGTDMHSTVVVEVSHGLFKTERVQEEEGADTDIVERSREFKRKREEVEKEEEEVVEVLDLSLSRKHGRSNTEYRKRRLEGAGDEAMLLMEVDEIEVEEGAEEEQEEEEEKNSEVLSKEDEMGINFNLLNRDATCSSSCSPASPSSLTVESNPTGILLIDDQGVPYMLTPDGQKVLQVELPKPCKAFTDSPGLRPKPRPKSKRVKVAEESTVILTPDVRLSNQVSSNTLPCQTSDTLPSHLASLSLPESSVLPKTVLPSGPDLSTEAALQTKASQPIRILTNSTSTSPILLLPSSHLSSLSSSKSKSNSGLMALSLPLSLTQKSPSAPLFLVISPLTTGSAPSSTSSALTVSNPVSSSLPLAQTSTSLVSLPLSSAQTNTDSSLPSSPPLSALSSDSSGNGDASTPPTPSVVSSPSSINHPNPEFSSKVIFPKRSPLRKLLKLETPSDTRSAPSTEIQIQCDQSPVSAPSSPVETTTNTPTRRSKAATSSSSKHAFRTHTSTDQLSTDPPYTRSGTPPPETIFPTNHPKNLSLSQNCPRRILYCQFCPRAFYYLSDLERHSITHSQSKPHVCPLCSKAFKRSSHLERHKHIHTGQRNFICPICSKRFREAGELLRHQRVHTGEKPFQCPQCHMRFAERNTLRRHAKRKHQDQQGTDGQEEGSQASDGGGQVGLEESAEWYSSTVPELDSDNETN